MTRRARAFAWVRPSGPTSPLTLSGHALVDLMQKCPWFRLGHLRVGKLQHWQAVYARRTLGQKATCFGWATFGWASYSIDLSVQFKLQSGIRVWTQIWVQVQLGSSGPHCTKWDDDQQIPSGLGFPLGPDIPRHSTPLSLSTHALANFRLKAPLPRLRLGQLQVGELHLWHLYLSCIALDLAIQFKLLSGIRT